MPVCAAACLAGHTVVRVAYPRALVSLTRPCRPLEIITSRIQRMTMIA